jgi:hypothetical protein
VDGDLSGMKIGELKGYVANMADKNFVVPSLRFGLTKDIEALWTGKPHPAEVAQSIASSQEHTAKIAYEQSFQHHPEWNPKEKLSEVVSTLHDADADNSWTEFGVRRALISGVNALQCYDLLRPVADDTRLTAEELGIDLQILIDELFQICWEKERYAELKTLGDAVVFVCDAYRIDRDGDQAAE